MVFNMLLVVNGIIKYEGSGNLEKILWISDYNEYCYVIEMETSSYPVIREIAMILEGIESKTIIVLKDIDASSLITLEPVTAKDKEYQERAWEVIKMTALHDNEPGIYLSKQRKQLIYEASKKFEISQKTVSRYINTGRVVLS